MSESVLQRLQANVAAYLRHRQLKFALAGDSFRRWDGDNEVCSVIEVVEYPPPYRAHYTIELGFFSRFLHQQISGLAMSDRLPPLTATSLDYPTTAMCRSSGLSFRLEELVGRKEPGWYVANDDGASSVAAEFTARLDAVVDSHLDRLEKLAGWEPFLRERMITRARRGAKVTYDLRLYAFVLIHLPHTSANQCAGPILELQRRAARRFRSDLEQLRKLFSERFGFMPVEH